ACRQRLARARQLLEGDERVDETHRRVGRKRLGLQPGHDLTQYHFHLAQTHEETPRQRTAHGEANVCSIVAGPYDTPQALAQAFCFSAVDTPSDRGVASRLQSRSAVRDCKHFVLAPAAT